MFASKPNESRYSINGVGISATVLVSDGGIRLRGTTSDLGYDTEFYITIYANGEAQLNIQHGSHGSYCAFGRVAGVDVRNVQLSVKVQKENLPSALVPITKSMGDYVSEKFMDLGVGMDCLRFLDRFAFSLERPDVSRSVRMLRRSWLTGVPSIKLREGAHIVPYLSNSR
jgi:hypothetical protein